MTLAFKLDLNTVKVTVNQQAKYLGQSSRSSKVFAWTQLVSDSFLYSDQWC